MVLDACKFVLAQLGAAHSWGSKLKRLEKEAKKVDPEDALASLFGDGAPSKSKG